jgi:predicted Zn finger-like uncharacterized protein
MFTVCPKCALTLVVTAADLRVAQGYVRCGRCSNVFNALSRLSEDRAAASAQAQASPQSAPAPKPAQTPQQRSDASGTFSTSTITHPGVTKSSPPAEPKRYDDDTPDEDLEFNPDATDLNKVFVEQPPSPQFTAATGTFKALRLEAEETARSHDLLAETDEREGPPGEHFDPTDTQVDVEIDPDLLASMARLPAGTRPNPTAPAPARQEPPAQKAAPQEPPRPKPAPTPKQPASFQGSPDRSGHEPAHPRPAPPSKQPPPFQPLLEQPPLEPQPMRLAERAKARAAAAQAEANPAAAKPKPEPVESKREAERTTPRASGDSSSTARTGSNADTPGAEWATGRSSSTSAFETSEAIRAALAPRKRPSLDLTSAAKEEPTPWYAGMWTAGCAVLGVLLLMQIVHHYRHDLATNPTLNGPLTAIYAVLGIPVVPRWDLSAYEVRQLGASTTGQDQIRVLASVKNTGHQAQPLPLLRVTLQDRFGNRIASRDVPPQSYLPRAIPSSSLLSAGQRIDAEMTFVDPGSNAVGFEIDACLPAAEGGIVCGNEANR